jgi:spore cortex formation protein SpoVR/YcgB (stage V sporulation)
MTTIHLSDRITQRLHQHGIANVEAFVEALLAQMDDAEITAASQHIQPVEAVETRIATLQGAFAAIREGIADDDWRAIVEAMNSEHIESADAPWLDAEDTR